MKRERLRLPVWILTIILTLTMTPMGAFAETAEVSEGTDATGFVAEESQNKEAPADQTEAAQTADFQTVDLQLTEAAGSADEADTILVMGIFDKKNYKISFDSNLGWFTYVDNMPDDEKVQKNGSYTIPENVPTCSGKVFTGWNTKSNGKGDSYQPGDTISKVKNNTTLYAQWKNTYDINFHDNLTLLGIFELADNMPDDGTVIKGETYTIPSNIPTYSGWFHSYALTSWNTDSWGYGTEYKPGDKIENVTGNINLYAQWREVTLAEHLDVRIANKDVLDNISRVVATINGVDYDTELEREWDGNRKDGYFPEFRTKTNNIPVTASIQFTVYFKDGTPAYKTDVFGEEENSAAYNRCYDEHPWQFDWGMDYVITAEDMTDPADPTPTDPADPTPNNPSDPEDPTPNNPTDPTPSEPAEPVYSSYTVEYYFQNADDEGYTNDKSVTLTVDDIEVGTEINTDTEGVKQSFENFTFNPAVSSSVLTGTVSETEDTVLKLYYDRNTFKVNYAYGQGAPENATDLTGDAYREATYKYGQTVTVAPAASAEYYDFSGWKCEGLKIENGTFTMPAKAVTLTGMFARQTASYKVEYYLQNANDNGYTQDTEATLTAKVDAGTKINLETKDVKKSFENFTLNTAAVGTVSEKTTTASETVVLKLYYDRNTFKVNYAYGQGAPATATDLTGEAYKEATYKYGQTVTVAPAASAENYDFSGWKCEGLKIENGTFTMPAKAVTLTGMFTRQTASYKVEYYLQNANDNGYTQDTEATLTAKVDAGTKISLETKDVKKSFENFTLNTAAVGTVSEKTTTASETVVLKLYYDRNTFKVNYAYGQGAPATATDLTGEAYKEATYKYGQTVTLAPAASAENYDFNGWKCEGLKIENGTFTMPAKAVTFTGSFTKKKASYTVQYYLENADDEGFTLAQGETETVNGVDVETVIDTKTNGVLKTFPHYSFYADATGSELSGEVVAASEEQPQGLVLKLYYNRNRSKVSYTFGENAPEGVSALPESFEGKYGQTIKLPEAATAPGHTFKCWNVITAEDETESVEAQAVETAEDGTFIMPDGQVTIFGEFTVNSYEVKYVDGVDGAAFAEQSKTAEYGTETPKFDGTPARTGYTFEGWTPEVAEKVSEDAVYTATWKLIPAEDNGNSGRDGGRTSGGNGVTTITDDQVPLAEMPELNTKDHTAYVLGYEDGTVKPENKITRAEVATIFFRLLTEDSRMKILSTVNSFSDASAADWFNEAVSTLSNGGVINGYTDGTFKPSGNITRAEFATIAARFDSSAVDTSAIRFTDISGHWAEASIKKAAALGYINGYEDGSFRPDAAISRAEAMALLNRVLGRDKITAEGLLADQMTTFSDNPVTAWYYTAVQEATNSHDHVMENGAEAWTAIK